MPANTTPIFANVIKNPAAQILPADASAYKTLMTGGANGSRLDNLIATSNDTSARVLSFAINDGALDHPIGEVSIPATAGNDGAASVKGVSVLNSTNFPGLKEDGSLYLQSTFILKVKSLTTVTAAKQIDLVGFGGDF
ncbi:MAG: hypothetical protein K8H84_11020 [Sulfuricella denitrificans]|nr:hypothetical protein [Sulfuricella denitrificans]